MRSLGVLLSCLCFASAGQAQIYKWVDAEGRTHYSSNKDDAQGAKPAEVTGSLPPLNVQPSKPAAAAMPASTTPQTEKKTATAKAPAKPPAKAYDATRPETDEDRCIRARKVLNGGVWARGGTPADAHDRSVAENDVRISCRSK